MITVTDNFKSDRLYDLEHKISLKYKNKKVAYFDIETTGFSSKTQQIYMIGAAYKNKDDTSFTIMQWFDDTSYDECKILLVFREFLKDFDVLVDYNGNSFDIPFIENRGIKYGIVFCFDKFILLDIYKEIKRYKNFFKTPDLKQKSIEFFLGIERNDKCDGGMLIEVYKTYLKEKNTFEKKALLSLLMLHNHDDIIGLVNICDILSYLELFQGNFEKKEFIFEHAHIILKCQLDFYVKKPVFDSLGGISFELHDNSFHILIPLEKCELKYFYDNYKEYYYLPEEDTAIHKSVAQFVDKEYKQKATKENCYIRKEAVFAIQYSEIFKPAFKQNYKDKVFYFEVNENNISNLKTADLQKYVSDLLNHIY